MVGAHALDRCDLMLNMPPERGPMEITRLGLGIWSSVPRTGAVADPAGDDHQVGLAR